MRRVTFLVAIALATLTSCSLYEEVETIEIHPPTIEQEEIIIPDWDNQNE